MVSVAFLAAPVALDQPPARRSCSASRDKRYRSSDNCFQNANEGKRSSPRRSRARCQSACSAFARSSACRALSSSTLPSRSAACRVSSGTLITSLHLGQRKVGRSSWRRARSHGAWISGSSSSEEDARTTSSVPFAVLPTVTKAGESRETGLPAVRFLAGLAAGAVFAAGGKKDATPFFGFGTSRAGFASSLAARGSVFGFVDALFGGAAFAACAEKKPSIPRCPPSSLSRPEKLSCKFEYGPMVVSFVMRSVDWAAPIAIRKSFSPAFRMYEIVRFDVKGKGAWCERMTKVGERCVNVIVLGWVLTLVSCPVCEECRRAHPESRRLIPSIVQAQM